MTVECLSVPENATGMVKLHPTLRSTTCWLSLETQTSSLMAHERPAMHDSEFFPPHA